MSYEYDVALSFAGEDRKFVEDCAEILRSLNIILKNCWLGRILPTASL